MEALSQFIEMFGNPISQEYIWPKAKLGRKCIVNPFKRKSIDDELLVSFIPMQDIHEDGTVADFEVKPYVEVKKGFTYCEDNDVLFAKITPCMENGKGAVMRGLSNQIGFGSTEFHVLRPIDGMTCSEWLYALTKLDIFRIDASKNMTGTGGQKRVPTSYLENFEVGIPPMDLQLKFASIAQQADKSKFGGFKSQFIEMFGNPVTNSKEWNCLSINEIAPESPSSNKEYGNIWVLNLNMIESNSGKIVDKEYDSSDNLLSVFPFDEDNVLFSKLRPYLNKVVIPNGKGYATTELVPLRPQKDKLNKIFFSFLLRSDHFVSYANSMATGTKMPRMPLSELRKFMVILPPMDLQLKFASIAQQADKSKVHYQKIVY